MTVKEMRKLVEGEHTEDENKVLAEYARKKLDSLPSSFKIGADEWQYYYDNVEGGSFFDSIEER